VPQHHKTGLILELLKRAESGSVLVFTRTKHRANRLMQQLARAGHSVAALHSNRSQNQRQIAMEGFRAGRFRILVATDIAARGLDVDRVSHVINYDVPDTPDAYIHRIGRTGRAERTGEAFTLITPEDVDQVRAIEKAVGHPLERRTVAGFDYAAPAPLRSNEPEPRHDGRAPQGQPRRDGRAPQGQPRRDGRAPQGQRGEVSAPRELQRDVAGQPRRPERPTRRSA
jgi:ATP-dependent RNA helicase RhlE